MQKEERKKRKLSEQESQMKKRNKSEGKRKTEINHLMIKKKKLFYTIFIFQQFLFSYLKITK